MKIVRKRHAFRCTAAILLFVALILTIWISKSQIDRASPRPTADKTWEGSAATKGEIDTPSAKLPAAKVSIPPPATANSTIRAGSDQNSESPVALANTSASLRSANRALALVLDDGIFERVMIQQDESVELVFQLNTLRPGEPIFITAPDGGSLKRDDGSLEFIATSKKQKLNLTFKPSASRGAFTIRILHGGESLIVDLWAGAANPLGVAGEPYLAPAAPVANP